MDTGLTYPANLADWKVQPSHQYELDAQRLSILRSEVPQYSGADLAALNREIARSQTALNNSGSPGTSPTNIGQGDSSSSSGSNDTPSLSFFQNIMNAFGEDGGGYFTGDSSSQDSGSSSGKDGDGCGDYDFICKIKAWFKKSGVSFLSVIIGIVFIIGAFFIYKDR